MRKNPGMAALLSFFFPGAGMIYCERIWSGLIAFIVYLYFQYHSLRGMATGYSFWREETIPLIIIAIAMYLSLTEARDYNKKHAGNGK